MKRILLVLSLYSALSADPFTAAPGTKARGLAGAFTAISNTASAAYYNPAGTASLKNDTGEHTFITLGYNPNALDESEYMSDNFIDADPMVPDLYFAVGVISSKWGFSYMINNMTLVTSNDKFYNASVGTMGIGFALSDSLKLGATLMQPSLLGMINSSLKDSDEFDPFLFAIAVGMKYEVYNSYEDSFNIAAAYRIGVIDDLNDNLTTGIPDKLSLGVNYNKSMGMGSLSLSVDYDITYIGSVTYYEDGPRDESSFGDTITKAFGAEYAMSSFIIRAGYSTSDIERTYDANWNNRILSVGITIPYDNDFVEASIEKRSYDFNQAEGVEESTLLTFSYHFSKIKGR